MTEQEALELGKKLYANIINNENNIIKTNDYIEFVGMTIKALEEVEQYRAIGTVEECRAAVEKRDKIYEQIETKILGKVCIGCGYLRDNICTYKGSNCGVSKPMYEDIKQVFEKLKGGGVDE